MSFRVVAAACGRLTDADEARPSGMGGTAARFGLASLVGLALAAPLPAALDVREIDGELAVLRDGRVLVSAIVPDRGDVGDDDVKSSFAVTDDGARVWNRWSQDPDRRFRLEVAARADGAVEITLMGEVGCDSACRRRMLHLGLPDQALLGKRYRRVSRESSSAFRAYGEEDGVFEAEMKPFVTRFLAADGVVYDFNPLGPGDESGAILWEDSGNQLNNNGVGGYWQVCREGGGFRFSCGGDVAASWGGFAGGKAVIREGDFSDFDRLHAIRTFHYPLRLEPTRLLAFGAPRHGERHADGDRPHDETLRVGWLPSEAADARRTVVGHREGALYSCVTGRGRAVYRLSGLVDGWHILSFQAGNYAGVANRFSVTAGGERLLSDATVPKGTVRRLSKAVRVKGGRLDVELDGDWLVSVIGDQALLAEGEDFSVSRGFWVTDGFEPCTLFRNADYKTPFAPELRDETDVLPAPGSESAAKRHAVPMPVERPSADDPRLTWLKTAKMERLLGNSVSMSEFDRPGSLDAYADRQFAGKDVKVVMLSGMHSRHTYLNHVDRGIEAVRRICEVLHRRGVRVIDHHDSTLLWNVGAGFRVMMERLSETALTRDAGLPTWQFCPSNRKFTRTYYEYLRKLVEAGVDGFQIDELEYWSLGCRCHDCREAFRRDTGWEIPLNEADATFNDPESLLHRVWRDWRRKAVTNWFVGLRRHVKDLRDDLILSVYTTNDAFCFPNHCRYVSSDLQDIGRADNYFGSEMMSRSALRDARNLIPMLRMRAAVAPADVPPLWVWWYNVDYPNEYFAWGLSALVNQTPLLSAVPVPEGGAQFEAFDASPSAMDRDGVEPVGEIALLFPAYSRDWNRDGGSHAYRRELFGTAQTLDAMHVPYRFVSDDQLASGRLDSFKALLVGEAQCLSDAEVAAVKAFADRGGRVRMTTRAGACDELGTPRAEPAFAPHPNITVTEETRAAPFEQWETWNTLVWTFSPDREAEAAFRRELLEWCGGAQSWKIDAPEKVFVGVWREKSGDFVVHFLNGTGEKMKVGEPVASEAPDPPFPAIESDIAITAPASAVMRAVAASPDFKGEVELAVRRNADGTATVSLPKSLLSVYTLVRLSAKTGR